MSDQPSFPPPGHAPPPPPVGYAAPPSYVAPSGAVFNPRPGIIPLRPLGVGDILDGAFKTFRRNQGSVLALSLLVNSIAALPSVALTAAIGAGLINLPTLEDDPSGEVSSLLGLLIPIGALAVATSFATILLPVFVSYVVGEATLGRRATIAQVWTATKRRILPAIGIQVLVALVGLLIMGLGLSPLVGYLLATTSSGSEVSFAAAGSLGLLSVLAVVVGLAWFNVKVLFATTALVLEGTSVRESLRRSFALTRGRFWRTLGISLLAGLLASVISQVVQYPIGLFTGLGLAAFGPDEATGVAALATVQIIGTVISTTIVGPFIAAITSLLYVDARIRSEGFDHVLLRAANPDWR